MQKSETIFIERTEDEQKRAIEIYDKYRDELNKRQLSNTENYDRSILTLSSSALALSLTFFKFIVPVDQVTHLWLIKLAWLLFLLATVLSLVAYLISNLAIKHQLKIAEDYYINRLASAGQQKNIISSWNNLLNYFIGVVFSVALVTVVLFMVFNLNT